MTNWGPLATPIHPTVPEGQRPSKPGPVWKDNAFNPFWDPEHDIYGTWHVSTSPVGVETGGRLARFTLHVDGRTHELIEPLPEASFHSDSIRVDLDGVVEVDAAEISGRLDITRRAAIANFGESDQVFLGPTTDPPLQHFVAPVDVHGEFTVRGKDIVFDAQGSRDRSWGFRDESLGVTEWVWTFVVFPDFALNVFRIVYDDNDITHGRLFTKDGTSNAVGISEIARDPSALFVSCRVQLESGEELELRSTGRRTGMWVPMSPHWERVGQSVGAYDEFHGIRTDRGDEGFGIFEQARRSDIY